MGNFDEWYERYVGKALEKAAQDRQAVLDAACGPLRRQATLLAMELSKARILPDNGKCNRCKVPFWAHQCTQCWLEWSSRKAKEDAK